MRHPLLLVLFVLFSLALRSQSTAVNWSEAMDVGQSGLGYLRPRIALNGEDNPVVIWGRSSPAANFVSVGNGGSFSSPVEINPAGIQPSVADWMGSGIAANGNTIWSVFKALPEEVSPCYVVRSDDGGYTWGDTMRVDPFDGLVSRFPSIAVNANGPVVQYMQFTSGYLEPRQVVARMTGSEFMAPVQVSAPFSTGEVCDCCMGQIVAAGENAIALYRNAGSNIRVIWGSSSTDEGASFPTGALLDPTDWNLSACPSSGPAGFIDGDSLRYVWMSGATNGNKVYFGSAVANDLATGSSGLVHPDQAQGLQQNFPRIAGHADTIGVVWQQSFGSQTEVLFSWSISGFQGLSIPDTVNSTLIGGQKTPDIAFSNGAFHIVWSEVSAGTVRYRKATLINATGFEEAASRNTFEVWPVPADDRLTLRMGTLSPSVLRIVDLAGRISLELPNNATSLDVSSLSSGLYRLIALGEDANVLSSVPLIIAR
ncbi:MAG: T9SS type A sorting domain-containing protein [Flavobacteriales bacterium]|nr:T9SS type A sorting domain-containing protein [Flavobacteriales bacterium]